MSFSNLGLSSSLIKIISDQGYTQPYPIQREAIPAILKKQDVLGISATGSGKTASYVLPILMGLHANVVSKNRHVKVLVLVPTRELATQVLDVFKLFGSALANPVKSLAVFGGVSINPQMMAMQLPVDYSNLLNRMPFIFLRSIRSFSMKQIKCSTSDSKKR